uniref:Uncharacterized protein n=1 Tax=Oryza punctata TaxID=4537 RepID=A0A0E0JQ00_ORYPU
MSVIYLVVSKGKMPRRHIEIMSEDSDDNSSDPELEASTESDDDNSINEDNEKSEEAELNKVLYELHKKKTKKSKGVFNEVQLDEMLLELHRKNVLLNMKLDLMSSCKNVVRKRKAHKMKATVKTYVSFTRFSAKYFTEVLSSLSGPQKEVIDKYGFGSLLLFDSNFVPNKFATWIAKKVNVESSTIVLDNKSIHVTKEAVHAVLGLPIGGLEFGKNYEAGRKFILSKFGKKSMPPVIYLDHCDFGNRNVQQGVPRSAFWKRDMISTYTELDLVDDNNYGLSPLKDFSETCYPQRNSDTFSNRLESALGDLFPENVKDKICSMMASHCLTSHITSNHSCQDIIISILLMLADSNFDDLGHPPDNNACDRHGFDMSVQSEKQTVACTDSTPKSFHPDINEDAVVTLPHNEAQHQCQNNDIATPIIPFHCFQTTPVETSNTKLKNTYERNSNIEFSEIVKKIPFKDLTR